MIVLKFAKFTELGFYLFKYFNFTAKFYFWSINFSNYGNPDEKIFMGSRKSKVF